MARGENKIAFSKLLAGAFSKTLRFICPEDEIAIDVTPLFMPEVHQAGLHTSNASLESVIKKPRFKSFINKSNQKTDDRNEEKENPAQQNKSAQNNSDNSKLSENTGKDDIYEFEIIRTEPESTDKKEPYNEKVCFRVITNADDAEELTRLLDENGYDYQIIENQAEQ